MSKKYQIFVSSTYEDLRQAREQVIKATLEMGHIPVGMEMFSAADEEQWKLIARTIDQSDYYVVVVAHRYGSMVGDVSYTEMEYDYAVRQGVPVIGFILDEGAHWSPQMIETDQVKVAALTKFKQKVKRKPVGFWSSPDDLHGKFSIALMKLMNTNPRLGWVRETEQVSPAVMTELSRLSSENAKLRKQIEDAKIQHEQDSFEAIDRTVAALQANTRPLSIKMRLDTTWSTLKRVSFLELFEVLAPELMIEKSIESASSTIGVLIGEIPKKDLASSWPVPRNVVKEWFADLAALGLLEPSERKHAVSDTNEYWTLTDYGREIHSRLRRAVLEKGIQTEQAQEPSTAA